MALAANGLASLVVAAAVAASTGAAAQSVWGTGTIDDPENAGSQPRDGSGSESPSGGSGGWGSGAIDDPENPASTSPSGGSGGWGSGGIDDPENPASASPSGGSGALPSSGPAPDATPTLPRPSGGSAGPPRAIFSGAFESTAAVDTRRDDEFENTLETLQELEMRVRFTITERWRAVVEGRLGWFLTAGGDPDAPPWVPESDRIQGRLAPELRDFYVAGRAGRWLFRFGNQVVVWGSTDVSKPADIINPLDLRRGLSVEREDMRIPVPALDAIHTWDRAAWEFLVVPFFVPNRLAVYGSDVSPIRPSGLTLPAIPGLDGLTLFDPSLEDLAQPLLLQSSLPEERPRNASLGTRLTLSPVGWDVSAGYLYTWDRTPYARLSPPARAALEAVVARGADFFAGDVGEIPEVAALIESLADGEEPVSATYERLHMVEIDGVTYAGPVGIRFEAAFSPEKTTYLANLRSVRRPTLSTAAGLSYERSDGEIIATGEVFHTYVAPRAGDGPYLYGLDSMLGTAAALRLGLAAFDRVEDGFAADVSFDLAVIYLPDGRDLVLAPAVAWAATDRLTLSVGATVFESFGDTSTFGDLVDRNDAVFARLTRVF